MLAALTILAAATVAPAATPPQTLPPQTLQQRFDKAMELADAGDCVNAVPMFEGLKSAPAFKSGTLGGAMVAVHQGSCMIRMGAFDSGQASLEAGLPLLRQAGHQFDIDIAMALTALGDIAMERWQNARAKVYYAEALGMKDAAPPITLNVKLAKATSFDGGPEPLRYAEEAIRLLEAKPKPDKDQLAALHTIHARILLNQGRNQEAYDELKQALRMTGGLDLTVTLSDIALRSDLAVAAQLSGDMAGAREYLAYTGAGRVPNGRFEKASSMSPPVCGEETGLKPDDMAIVQFAVNEDGSVLAASTVYSRGSSEVAAAFARAVSSWVWDPEVIKTVPPFLRKSAHVELRCTTTAQEVPDVLTPLRSRFGVWAAEILKLEDANPLAAVKKGNMLFDRLKAIAAGPGGDADGLRIVAAKGLVAISEPTSAVLHDKLLSEALSSAEQARAPQDVLNWLEIERTIFRVVWSRSGSDVPKADTSTLIALLDRPAVAQDPLASDTIRIQAATKTYNRPRANQWQELLQQAASDDRLADNHPLRQLANLSLADDAASRKDFAAAQRYFSATGLTEEQCALLGMQPVMQRSGLSSNDFPDTAMQYGFEGWVNVEYDIRSDGSTAGLRPTIAYPPFIFNSAAVSGLSTSRFQASYRPEGGNACSANRTSILFVLAK